LVDEELGFGNEENNPNECNAYSQGASDFIPDPPEESERHKEFIRIVQNFGSIYGACLVSLYCYMSQRVTYIVDFGIVREQRSRAKYPYAFLKCLGLWLFFIQFSIFIERFVEPLFFY
jgi:hypothetical protein